MVRYDGTDESTPMDASKATEPPVLVEGCFDANGLALDETLGNFEGIVEKGRRKPSAKGFTVEQWLSLNDPERGARGHPMYVEHREHEACVGSIDEYIVRHNPEQPGKPFLCIKGKIYRNNPGANQVYEMLQSKRAGLSVTYRHATPDEQGQILYKRVHSVSFTTDPLKRYALVRKAQSATAAAALKELPADMQAATPVPAAVVAAAPVAAINTATPMQISPPVSTPTPPPTQAADHSHLPGYQEMLLKAAQAEKAQAELEQQRAQFEALQQQLAAFQAEQQQRLAVEKQQRVEDFRKRFEPVLSASSFDANKPEDQQILEELAENQALVQLMQPHLAEHEDLKAQLELERKNRIALAEQNSWFQSQLHTLGMANNAPKRPAAQISGGGSDNANKTVAAPPANAGQPRFTARQPPAAAAAAASEEPKGREGKAAVAAPVRPKTDVPPSMFDPRAADTHGLFSGCNLVSGSGGAEHNFVDQSSAILKQPQLVTVQQNAQKGQLSRDFDRALNKHFATEAYKHGTTGPELRARNTAMLNAMMPLLNRPTSDMRIVEELNGRPVRDLYGWGLTGETVSKGIPLTKPSFIDNPYDSME